MGFGTFWRRRLFTTSKAGPYVYTIRINNFINDSKIAPISTLNASLRCWEIIVSMFYEFYNNSNNNKNKKNLPLEDTNHESLY